MIFFLGLSLATVAGWPVVAVECFRAWRQGLGSLPGRIAYSLVTLAAASFVLFALQWNLLGFHY